MEQVKVADEGLFVDLRSLNIFDSLKIVTTASVQHFALCDEKCLRFLVNSEEAKRIILQASLQNVEVEADSDNGRECLAV